MSERLRLECPCGRAHVLDVTATRDPRGSLVVLNDGWGPIPGGTLNRWAREGRLVSHDLGRGKRGAWEASIRAAVEAKPATAAAKSKPKVATDRRLRALLDDPALEAG